MKTTLALLSAGVALWGATGFAEDLAEADGDAVPAKEKATAWEHLAFPTDANGGLSDPEFARKINELGQQGWEMVSVVAFTKDGTTTKTVYYFKRPK